VTDLLETLRPALAGRYEVERQVGRGGMATVFLAQELHPRRRVAIKVLDPEIAATVGPDRFLREVDIAAALAHPHVVPIFTAGTAAGHLYYTMPYIAGESLRARLTREGPLPVPEALRIAAEVADALDYAHRHDIVHRDIKPENVLFQEGHALVADFGVARVIAEAGARLTQTGVAVGTPLYMSPEQASGESRLDGRSDVYGLGCVLYEMLTGTVPFTGPTAQAVLARHIVDPVPPLATLRPGIQPGVVTAVNRALAKIPADRWASAADFARALRGEASTPVTDAPVPPADRRTRAARFVAIGLGAAILGAGAWAVVARSASRESPPSEGEPPGPVRMVLVPAGTYRLFGGACPLCLPERVVRLDSVRIDRTEVTVGAYAAFVSAAAARTPWSERPASDLPVTGVLWEEAAAYCRWRDSIARLPTEEEWEAAARGSDGRQYPWGDTWFGDRTNAAGGQTGLSPVGAFPTGAAANGAVDLAGNAWEWTATAGPPGPRGEGRYVLRGGAYDSPASVVTTFFRTALPARVTSDSIAAYFGKTGFRCARAAP
jgi:formylglycine-generating enzyme required for sulfatase activity/tRNA A-37 threonylcarbamoyl transferase component Bud32